MDRGPRGPRDASSFATSSPSFPAAPRRPSSSLPIETTPARVEPLGDNASGTAALIELARGFAPQEVGPDPVASAHARARLDRRRRRTAARAQSASRRRRRSRAPRLRPSCSTGSAVTAGRASRSPATSRCRLHAPLVSHCSRARRGGDAGPAGASLHPDAARRSRRFRSPAASRAGSSGTRSPPSRSTDVRIRTTRRLPSETAAAALDVRRLGQLGRATRGARSSSLDASVGGAFRTPDSLFFGDRAASGWTVRLTLVLAVVPVRPRASSTSSSRGRRRSLPFRPALRALRTRLALCALRQGYSSGSARSSACSRRALRSRSHPSPTFSSEPPIVGLDAARRRLRDRLARRPAPARAVTLRRRPKSGWPGSRRRSARSDSSRSRSRSRSRTRSSSSSRRSTPGSGSRSKRRLVAARAPLRLGLAGPVVALVVLGERARALGARCRALRRRARRRSATSRWGPRSSSSSGWPRRRRSVRSPSVATRRTPEARSRRRRRPASAAPSRLR